MIGANDMQQLLPKAEWDALQAIGVESPFQTADEWLVSECIDVEAIRLLRGVRLNQPGWSQPPISLWRLTLLSELASLSMLETIRAAADSMSLRMFCRLGFLQAPPTQTLYTSFVKQKRGELTEAIAFVYQTWTQSVLSKRERGRRPRWKEIFDQWAARYSPGDSLRVLQ